MQAQIQYGVQPDAKNESGEVSFLVFPSLSYNIPPVINNITSSCTFDPN